MDDQGPAGGDERPARSLVRRVVWGVGRTLFWLLAFVGTLLASVVFHLDSPIAREAIVGEVAPILNETLAGDFSMSIEHVHLQHIEIHDFVVRDPEGVVVLSIDEVGVDVSRLDLFVGRLVVDRVRVRRPFVDLGADDEGELRIANAFTPVEPSPDEPSTGPLNLPHIVVRDILLEDGRVDRLGPELDVRGLRLDAEAIVDDRIDVTVRDLDAELVRRGDGDVVASVERFDGEVQLLEPGAESTVNLRVAGMEGDYVEGPVTAVWGESYPDEYQAELAFRGSPATLEAAGLPDVAELLAAPVEGRLTADGSLADAIDARVELDTAGGPLLATARLSEGFERIDARVESTGVDLGAVLTPMEGSRFEGAIDAQLHPPGDDGRRRVVVDGEAVAFSLDGETYRAPQLHAAATLGDEDLDILELDVPHLEGEDGHLDVTGRVGFDGSMDLLVDAELPNLAADPNLREVVDGPIGGGLTVDARVRLDPGGEGEPMNVDVSGRVSGRNLRTPWLTARSLDVNGSVRGNLPAPQANVRLRAEDLRADDTAIQTAQLTIAGGGPGGRYAIDGNVRGSMPDMELDADVDLVASVEQSGAVTVDGRTRVRGPMPEPVTVELNRARIDPARGVRVAGMRVQTGDMGVNADGFLDLNGRGSDARIELERVDLQTIARRFGLGDLGLSGMASARIAFTGSMDRPVLDTDGRVEDLELDGVHFQRASWDIDLQPDGEGGRVLVLSLSLDSEGNGQAQVDARAELPDRRPLRALPDATWDATVTTANLRLGLVPELVEGLPEIEGRIDTQLTFRGTLVEPDLTALVSVRDLDVPEVDPVNVKLDGRLNGSDLRLEVDLRRTSNEPIASVVTNASDFTVAGLTSNQPLGFLASPWSVELTMPEQSLETLPAPARVEVPVAVSAQGRFSGGGLSARGRDPLKAALRAMTGQLQVLSRYTDPNAEGCGQGRPRARMVLIFENGETELRVVGETGGVENLVVEAFVETPVHEWVETPPERIPEVELAVEARGLPLHDVPIVCETASGTLDLDVDGVDLFDAEPRVSVRGSVAGLTVGGSEPLDLRLQGSLDARRAEVSGDLSSDERIAMQFDGRSPVRWGGDILVPELPEDGRWQGHVRFDEAPVQPLLAAVPILSEPHGTIDGDVRASGVGTEVDVGGQLRMGGIGFVLRQPYLRIEDLNGGLALHDQTVTIDGLRFADRDGDVRVDGDIELDGWLPGSARIQIQSDDFPLRVEGVVYAFLDTDTEIEADFNPDVNRMRVRMRRTAVRLPMDLGRTLQPLTQHSDVIYEDQPGFDPDALVELEAEEPEEGESQIADRTEIRVSSVPFWVRRDDFSVQVQPRLTIVLDEDGVRMSGPVDIRRGFISFMGKEFEFKRGEVRFTGGNSVDPTVDIEATHDLGSGELITAKITGRLLRPELQFSSSRDASISNSEAIQLLVRGRPGASSQTATQQAASFLTGLFAGVLSSVTRQELGEYIPVFGIESEGGTATLRVGFQADQLIPDALDDVILGAYVEGYVGGGANSEGGGGTVTGGATVEFVLPRSLVWSGTYDVPTNWSVDLMWEP